MNAIEKPLISIIVPVYNVERYIDACLDSIKQQTYKNLEIILVEDCSTDNSNQIIQAHLADQRIRIIQHKVNGGLSAARNTGMQAATGEYMMFVDSDDLIESTLVCSCWQAAVESGADVVLLTSKPFQDGESVQVIADSDYKANSYKLMTEVDYFDYPHFAWLKFMRSELVLSKGLQFPVGQYYEDWPFHWQTGFVADKIIQIDTGYYHYRQRGDSITGSQDLKLLHTFSSQQLVIGVVEQYSASAQAKRVLANQIYSGLWFVLTSIDEQHLKAAVIQAKKHIETTSHLLSYGSPSVKTRLLLLNLKLPVAAAVPAIASMRRVLNKLSSARRKAKR